SQDRSPSRPGGRRHRLDVEVAAQSRGSGDAQALVDDDRLDADAPRELEPTLRAEDEDGLREAVGGGAVLSDDGHAGRCPRGEPGWRVEDVVVHAPLVDEVVLVVSARRDGCARGLEPREIRVRVARVADPDAPRPAALGAADLDLSTRVENEARESRAAQNWLRGNGR